jgi:histone acetyltransferase 1
MEKLMAVLPPAPHYIQNMDLFSAELADDKRFKPCGELVHSFKKELVSSTGSVHQNGITNGSIHSNGACPSKKTFEIFACDITTPKFSDYLPKMELFLKWYIDAATFIDADDEKWKFFIMYVMSYSFHKLIQFLHA